MEVITSQFRIKVDSVLGKKQTVVVNICQSSFRAELLVHPVEFYYKSVLFVTVAHIHEHRTGTYRKYRLDIYLRSGTFSSECVDYCLDVGHHLVQGGSRQVVGSDSEEELLRLMTGQFMYPCKNRFSGVPVDSSVEDVRISEEFVPFAVVGDAVPDEDYAS